jgi:transglutaminase-like putative cysteine protease
MADISEIKPIDRKIEIKHPGTKQPIGIRLTVLSMEDDRLKRLKRRIIDEGLHRNARGKHFKAEEIEDNRYALLFGASLDWEWYNPTGEEGDKDYDADAMPDFHGGIPEFNRKNFVAVCDELSWFADQVDEAVGDDDAFFKESKPN